MNAITPYNPPPETMVVPNDHLYAASPGYQAPGFYLPPFQNTYRMNGTIAYQPYNNAPRFNNQQEYQCSAGNVEDFCAMPNCQNVQSAQVNQHPIQSPAQKMQFPCQNTPNWDYAQCYDYYANGCYNSCQFVNFVDIEDFMNNEKRKERSRDAARCRRSRETEIFNDLAKALPLTQEQVSQLDKASIMRLAISYLRVRDMVTLVPDLPKDEKTLVTDESVFLKSLEGFLLVLSTEGDIIYLSENVSEYLGITQIDLMGQNIYEYSHPCDHDEVKEILSAKTQEATESPKSFFIRLKCTLTSKGRSVNLKSATYKVIHFTGHILQTEEESKDGGISRCLVSVGQVIPHPSNIEAPLPHQTFLTKHSLDMKFTYADDKMAEFLGYESDDLIGKSIYEYHHAMDSENICSAYKCLFSKGQCETNRYRFLAKTGGYVWVLTQATLIYDKIHKPQSIVCVNYIISGVQCKDEIYSCYQLQSSVKPEIDCDSSDSDTTNCVVTEKGLDSPCGSPVRRPVTVTAKVFGSLSPTSSSLSPPSSRSSSAAPSPTPRVQTATSKIFAPRTEEMNKGFLTFSDDDLGLTMLKDEPDDLTHLAPVAGDVCVPLEDHPFLSDMLDDFLLRDAFCPLLTDEPTDPFISYRNSCDPSPQLLSPNLSKNSDCSLPSLNSPTDSLGDEDQMSTFINLQMDEDPELAMKAPYIPMNMGDDLPLLMSDDLMWSSNEKGSNTSSNSKSTSDNGSSLAQLLSSSVNKATVKTNDGGGIVIKTDLDDYYNEKSETWDVSSTKSSQKSERIERSSTTSNSNKRIHSSSYNSTSNKRTKQEPKEKMSSELLTQLMSNNHNRGRPKGKSNWLLDSGGRKAACISQPSDSVLMNLLDKDDIAEDAKKKGGTTTLLLNQKDLQTLLKRQEPSLESKARENAIRKNSLSLLDPDAAAIPSLLDLTQQDYEVNAPVNNLLLQGEELLTALELNVPM